MIDNSDSNKVSGSKFYSKSLTYLISILEMINQEFTLKKISDTLGIEQPHVSYYIRRAREFRYITESRPRDRFKIIKLTQPGINFLDQYRNKVRNKRGASCRAENIRFKAPVHRMPPKNPDWDRVKMNNWSQYKSRVDDIKVRLNMGKSPTIEFLPSPLAGKNHDELYGILYHECTEAARKLEQTLDMEIGRLELEPGAEWVAHDPVARTICKSNGQVTIEGLGKINASKPLRRGEIEYFDLRRAVDYFEMPERVFRIEKMLEELLKSRLSTNDDVPTK
jgi:DNA-binding MarR family transcriptional regulator